MDHLAHCFDMILIGRKRSLNEVASVENFPSVLGLRKVRDLKDRWDNRKIGEDRHLDHIRGFVNESERQNFF